mgnify:FL=1
MVNNPKFNFVVVDENNEKIRIFSDRINAKHFIRIRPEFKIVKEVRADWIDIWQLPPCLF